MNHIIYAFILSSMALAFTHRFGISGSEPVSIWASVLRSPEQDISYDDPAPLPTEINLDEKDTLATYLEEGVQPKNEARQTIRETEEAVQSDGEPRKAATAAHNPVDAVTHSREEQQSFADTLNQEGFYGF